MSIKYRNLIPGALVVSGLLFGGFLANPAAHAGEVEAIMPAENMEAPAGSQIPERRLLETEKKVEALKAKLRAEKALQQQEALPQTESPKPKADKP